MKNRHRPSAMAVMKNNEKKTHTHTERRRGMQVYGGGRKQCRKRNTHPIKWQARNKTQPNKCSWKCAHRKTQIDVVKL